MITFPLYMLIYTNGERALRRILQHKYEVLQELGSGAEGQVILAKDLHLERLVAIKRTKNLSLLCEKELLMKLEHPGLPQIYDFFEEQSNCYLVMEYIEGITLRQYLSIHGRVEYMQAVQWALQLVEILQYLHNHRPAIIYRDLKPENIMIRQDGRLKLIDMGAAFRFRYEKDKEKSFCLAGTPGYSPSEQWKRKVADKTCDIYGLGTVFHEMLTGASPLKPPFERRPVREYDKSIPIGLEQIVSVCTAKRATDRYQTMEELQEALRGYRKIGKWVNVVWTIKRLAVSTCITGGVASLLLPLWQGVPASDFPLPFLKYPLLFFVAALLLQTLLFESGRRKRLLKHQEKSIWLTEKQFTGLLLAFVLLLGYTGLGGILTSAPTVAYAGANTEELWVELRGEDNRKLLLKKEAVYQPQKKVVLEVSVAELPEGKSALQLVAVGGGGEAYTSRIFYVKK